ncbi:probable leucine-rich repeat receptor-like protein kinase At1g68400 [Alnus glutinosa]|uniref:probable leucine-rich repeat receptor-like protein kinase At1g68400 n=1 Tax=Alnus glutinosa TaxID=3517 RepID=UPI002D77499E|nr:probable leucine-rich repeat receptor-like protein kinase At1g68400 [Alnus glutinosa]
MPKHKNCIGVEHKDKRSLKFCARPCIPPFLKQSQALPRTPHIILLDHSGTACISDIGLHHLFFPATASSSHDAYKAPELILSQRNNFTQKYDVYSFGVILLEILTGGMAVVEEGEMNLV